MGGKYGLDGAVDRLKEGQLAKARLRGIGEIHQKPRHIRYVQQLHAQCEPGISCKPRAEARRILRERDGRHSSHSDLPLDHWCKRSGAHASAVDKRPLQAARSQSVRAAPSCVCIEARITSCIVGLTNVGKTRAHG